LVPEALQEPFMQRALVAAAVAGFILPLTGCFIVPKRLSLLGDSSSHFVLASLALGSLLGLEGGYASYIAAVLGVFAALRLVRALGLGGDQALAILLSLSAAVASIAISRGGRVSLGPALFGSLLAVDPRDVAVGAIAALLTGLFILRNFGSALLYTLNEELARIRGVDVARYELLFAALTGLGVAVSVSLVGVLLVTALIVVPAVGSALLASSMRRAIALSILLGELSLTSGVLASYYLDVSPGAATVLFLLASLALAASLSRLGYRL